MAASWGYARRAGRHRAVWTAALGLMAALTLMPSDGASAPQSDPTLAEIIQRLRDWRQSFATIRFVWHEWCQEGIRLAHPELDSKFDPGGKYHVRLEFAIDGGAECVLGKTIA